MMSHHNFSTRKARRFLRIINGLEDRQLHNIVEHDTEDVFKEFDPHFHISHYKKIPPKYKPLYMMINKMERKIARISATTSSAVELNRLRRQVERMKAKINKFQQI